MKICNLHLSGPHPLTPSPRRGEINGGILSSVGRANGYPYDEPTRVGPLRRVRAKLPLAILGVVCLLLTGCYAETYDVETVSGQSGTTQVVLTFVTPNNSSTRSATNDPDGYEKGIGYEDYINIDDGDYKIYFFSYEENDEKGGTLIAEFTPDEVTSSSTSSTTTYIIKGAVPFTLLSVSNFRVVMLANWGGTYSNVSAGITTIDDLCEGENTTYSASSKFTIGQDNHIPFYGVQEYTDISFSVGETTTLSTPVSLLRAVAKVEVILTADSDVESFDNVSIVNYNSQGYCAPANVYLATDYDTEMKNNTTSGNWGDEWVKELHLVGDKNDEGSKTQAFTHVSGTTQDTWRIYLPEYDNTGTDYSNISLTVNGELYEIYFAEYDDDGLISNSEYYNLKRNNIYRFYVTLKNRELRVFVETWENVFDNEWSFGINEPEEVGSTFTSNNIMYQVLTSTVGNASGELTVCTIAGGTYTSIVEIPSTVRHNGFTYTVTEIGTSTFDGKEGITSITIPETITNIGRLAFEDCVSMTSLTILSYTPPTCEEGAFSMDNLSNTTLYVHTMVVQTYIENETWGSLGFKDIVGID